MEKIFFCQKMALHRVQVSLQVVFIDSSISDITKSWIPLQLMESFWKRNGWRMDYVQRFYHHVLCQRHCVRCDRVSHEVSQWLFDVSCTFVHVIPSNSSRLGSVPFCVTRVYLNKHCAVAHLCHCWIDIVWFGQFRIVSEIF